MPQTHAVFGELAHYGSEPFSSYSDQCALLGHTCMECNPELWQTCKYSGNHPCNSNS